MIAINVYENGWEIKGHSEPSVCKQVSLWHWISSQMIQGMDKTAKEYTSSRDNEENPNEGYSWLTYSPNCKDLNWVFDDLIISIERWVKEGTSIHFGEVAINYIEGMLEK